MEKVINWVTLAQSPTLVQLRISRSKSQLLTSESDGRSSLSFSFSLPRRTAVSLSLLVFKPVIALGLVSRSFGLRHDI